MGLISDGTTIFDAGAMASGFGSSMVFIKKLTASSSGTLSFVHGSSSVILDSTYKEYLFILKDIHGSVNDKNMGFNVSIDGGSNYNVAKTSSAFEAYHYENDGAAAVGYVTSRDLAEGTGFQILTSEAGADNEECACGTIQLFNPASTTFVKHYISRMVDKNPAPAAVVNHVAGYVNTTSAVNAVQFKMASGNIDAGTITLYGIS
jgi:hypothetical protein